MTTQPFPIPSVGCDPAHNLEVEDDLSTATPPAGLRNPDDDHKFVSETIRFYFPPADRIHSNCITPDEVHTQWLRIISSTFGNDAKIINNLNKPVLHVETKTSPRPKVTHIVISSSFIRSLSAQTHQAIKRSRTK